MTPEDLRPPTVRGQVEAYLDSLLVGEPASLEALEAGLSAAERAEFRATALAEEFGMRAAKGEAVVAEEWLARLGSEGERARFRGVLADRRAGEEALPRALLPGHVLDERYEIRREIGAGGMGHVYSAHDRELGRVVALKVLRSPPDAEETAELEQLFRRESRTLAQLESRNIVALHDVRRGREESYLVMDLVPGTDLARVLARARDARRRAGAAPGDPGPLRSAVGRPPPPERADLLAERSHERCAARILRVAARALEQAHAAGIVHRDLKPQNLVLLPGGEPMLLDFGLAAWRSEREPAGFRGTPEYLAPEQIEHASSGQDPRTDVYQLGLLFYELLTLEPAFPPRHGDLEGLFADIRAGRMRPARAHAPGLSPTLEAILARALARAPEERYPSARELGEDLDRYLARRPPKYASLPRARRVALGAARVARHPLAWVGALLVLIAAQFLHEGSWKPLLVRPFRVADGVVTALDPQQPLEAAGPCLLGIDVSTQRPLWLYVFSVFGADASPEARRLTPLAPEPLAAVLAPGHRAERAFGGLRLEPGEHRIACTRLSKPEPYEGLLVVACLRRDAGLERLQEGMVERRRALGAPVSLAEARALDEELRATVRGDPLSELTAAERASIGGQALDAPPPATSSDWLREGWYRFDFLFEVRRGGH